MEFSFDRSKEGHARRPEEVQPQSQQPQQSAGPRPGPDLNTVDPSTIANERLRKAIERNRAKQAASPSRAPSERPAANFSQAQAEQYHQQASFFSSNSQAQQQPQSQPEPQVAQELPREMPRPRARENIRPASAAATATSSEESTPRSSAVVSRRSVAKPEDTEFVPVKRTPKKVASHISYTTSSSRKKAKSMDPKYVNWLVKGSWIFCGLMVLRLIFAAGGVTDYYSQKNSVNDRINELTGIKKENMQLVREIERMRSDAGFQKRLVRDNLGFIAADEFLVLFPKER